NIIKNTWDKSV
nr:Chain C, Delta N-box peptide [Drosophila melanogaster]